MLVGSFYVSDLAVHPVRTLLTRLQGREGSSCLLHTEAQENHAQTGKSMQAAGTGHNLQKCRDEY